jgi:hypothetical protein
MKDPQSICSLTLHEGHHDAPLRLKSLKEYKYKEVKKRRKSLLRPTDGLAQCIVVGKPGQTFGATLSYNPTSSEYPDTVLCEVYVDSRKIEETVLYSKESEKGPSELILETMCSASIRDKLRFQEMDVENQDPMKSGFGGTIEAVFWRVMEDYGSGDIVADEGLPSLVFL